MLSRLRLLSLLPLAGLLACGSSSPSTTPSGFLFTSGDYVLVVAPSTAAASMLPGALTVTGTTVTGVFAYNNPQQSACGSQTISVSGSIVNDVATLTSTSFAGGSVATFVLQPLGTNTSGSTVGSGTAVIAGGSCALASTTLQSQQIPSFQGTWAITITTPTASTATLSITQSGPNATGQFPVTGMLSCSGNSTLTGTVIGATLQLLNSQSTAVVSANGSAVPVTVSACGGSGTMVN